jgi:DNA-binding NarL/FixJ family response regulator
MPHRAAFKAPFDATANRRAPYDAGALRDRALLSATSVERSSDESALDAWQAFMDGRFALVDSFDSGGRRFFVVRRDDIRQEPTGLLSDRETQVARLAACGYPNKLIAYELGLTMSLVAMDLASAIRKLGVRCRIDLIRCLLQEDIPESA